VRALIRPLPVTSSDADLPVPTDLDFAHATLVAFVQRELAGAIAQVVMSPLAGCG